MRNEKLCNLRSTSQTAWVKTVKRGEMGWTWSRDMKAQKCVHQFCKKTSREEIILQT